MFKISHLDPNFIINNHKFATRKDVAAYMKLIRRYANERMAARMNKEEAAAYVNPCRIEEAR